MTVHVSIFDHENRYVRSTPMCMSMSQAVRAGIADAVGLVCDEYPTMYVRDVLGGLRAEVRWSPGEVTVKRTT